MNCLARRHWPTRIASAIAITVMVGCAQEEPTVHTKQKRKPVPVRTVSAVETEIQQTTMQPATVHPFYRAEVRARISGYVGKVHADIGDFVQAGDVLAVIEVPEMSKQRQVIQARIGRQESEEARAEAGIQLAEANVLAARARLKQTRSELSSAEAELAALDAEFARTSDLVERRSLESRVLDEVRKKRDSARARREAMASAIVSAEADVTVAEAKLSAARADLKAAVAETGITRSQLEELDVLMEYATLKAPFAGIVTARTVSPGDLVREQSEVGKGAAMFVISQIDTVRVHIPVPEVDAARVSRGG